MSPNEQTIQRCPHDKENPYAQINRNLIRDETISPACRWMLIYLLSMQNGWKVSVKQLWNHIRKFHGREKIRALLDEAISAGYILRKDNFKGNLRQGCTYFISETPKFSKKLSDDPISGEPSDGEPQPGQHKEEQEEKKEHREELEESASPPPPPLSRADAAQEARHKSNAPKEMPKEAQEMSHKLYDKIISINPKAKWPNFKKWQKGIEQIHRIDRRSWQEISEMIDWAFDDAFWVEVIQSPEGLRRNWDKMAIKRIPKNNKGSNEKKNRELSIKIKSWFTSKNEKNTLAIFVDKVYDSSVGESIALDLPYDTFRAIIFKWYGITGEKDV